MRLVVDASVALKWVLDEAGSQAATVLIERDDLLAPDLLLIECANALTMRVRRKLLSADQAQDALETILAVPKRLFPSPPLVERAQALAIELGREAYDSLYLALAISERATLVTADEKFMRAVRANPAYVETISVL